MGEEWFKLCEYCNGEKKEECLKKNRQRFELNRNSWLCPEVRQSLSEKSIIDRPDRWLVFYNAIELDHLLEVDFKTLSVESALIRSLLQGIFISLDEYLNHTEATILRRYFLFGDTLAQIGLELEITPAAVQKRRDSALNKLSTTEKFKNIMKELKIPKKIEKSL